MAQASPSYPMIAQGVWWKLRAKFNQSIPGVITAGYLSAALNMQENSARANVLPALRQLGIIDADGKTQDRAQQWRDDKQYADVCKEMLEEVYPSELLAAVPEPSNNKDGAIQWFMSATGTGNAAAQKMVTVYSLLVDGDPGKRQAPRSKRQNLQSKGASPKKQAVKPQGKSETARDEAGTSDEHKGGAATGPSLYINLQIHVSSDATPDQIDAIFASMAKHIYHKE